MGTSSSRPTTTGRWMFAWHVGLAVLVLSRRVQGGVRPAGQRGAAAGAAGGTAGLAGGDRAGADRLSAAAVRDIAAVPLVGFAVADGHPDHAGGAPSAAVQGAGALAAVVLGMVLVFGGRALGDLAGAPLVPPAPARPGRGRAVAAVAVAVHDSRMGLVGERAAGGAGEAAGGAAVRPGDHRGRHRLHRERGGGRRRVRHADRFC